ncbi:zinc-binding dehydrogenase [Nocardia higoensis]|uniref:zinc-binding dehydrogenase n=1 Tax=Nocardia higoensis TaxID=228599 RepID=UPI0002ED85CB|nr:zinc-binding dehydrogenase [Nocardia higoensis]
MKAVQATAFGGPQVLAVRELPDPEPAAGEVLVDVEAADVMFLDTRLRSGWGREFFTVDPPYVPGGGISGTVRAVGAEVDPAWIGTRVVGATAASGIFGGVPTGGYAERALARADSLHVLPDRLSAEQACALIHDGRTSVALFDRADVRPGDHVLITAAAGGLGTLLIQLARLAGATVVAAARGQQKLALARRLGAETAIDYSEPGWTDRARAATGGAGFRVVLDGAGGALGDAALTTTADGGRFLGYGSAAGSFGGSDSAAAAARGVEVIGLLDLRSAQQDWRASAERALALAADGQWQVVIGQTYPLAEAEHAHVAIEARTALGRTLLTV